ncbi:hypothetical protein QBC38DRAFT_185012 [Podospora fimiseda]|uniref:Uncharacterized protein n=1 Tax=Podospora fimiseda TaxID=252190 RepID=A0AAN7BQQ7_9PEZI|nr:hypothetical protein QBC38DRAFT_185012 [Podospora fimiseda]
MWLAAQRQPTFGAVGISPLYSAQCINLRRTKSGFLGKNLTHHVIPRSRSKEKTGFESAKGYTKGFVELECLPFDLVTCQVTWNDKHFYRHAMEPKMWEHEARPASDRRAGGRMARVPRLPWVKKRNRSPKTYCQLYRFWKILVAQLLQDKPKYLGGIFSLREREREGSIFDLLGWGERTGVIFVLLRAANSGRVRVLTFQFLHSLGIPFLFPNSHLVVFDDDDDDGSCRLPMNQQLSLSTEYPS